MVRGANGIRSWSRPMNPLVGIAIAATICLLLGAPPSAAAAAPSGTCSGPQIRTASGCRTPAAAGRDVEAIVDRAVADNGLRAALVRVNIGDRTLATVPRGESIAGVPASRRMHFRIGAMAIPYLINVLLQLQDQGRLSLDDPVSNWLPDLPNADRVTLRMLASNTSGYPDWIQGNQAFVDELFADVFRQWTPPELLAIAFSRPLACEPGTCFNYAHTNFAIISQVLREVTGKPAGKLIRKRVLRPLGLRQIDISALPAIPEPVLHAYSSDRGVYEDSTFWSASWTIGEGTIMTGTIGNIAKTARAIGTGALISRRASKEQFAPITVDLPPLSEELYYALGIQVSNTWQFQNPQLNGYTGIMAYLPSRKLSLALTVTNGPRAAEAGVNYSQQLFAEIAGYLAPDHPVTLPP
jgi:D-alanyl-D-alanine carboxypeptidase